MERTSDIYKREKFNTPLLTINKFGRGRLALSEENHAKSTSGSAPFSLSP